MSKQELNDIDATFHLAVKDIENGIDNVALTELAYLLFDYMTKEQAAEFVLCIATNISLLLNMNKQVNERFGIDFPGMHMPLKMAIGLVANIIDNNKELQNLSPTANSTMLMVGLEAFRANDVEIIGYEEAIRNPEMLIGILEELEDADKWLA